VAIFDEMAAPGLAYPFVIVHGYGEPLPGTSLEDQIVEFDIEIWAASLDHARMIGTALKNAVDHPNNNPNSLGRDVFSFQGGAETMLYRDTSKPQLIPLKARGGVYPWLEVIHYEIFVSPEQ
jgi:hypothetical protein